MSDIALQLELSTGGAVAVENNVVFDTIVYQDGEISYDDQNGVIQFNEAGRYVINWWVASQAASSTNGVVFAIRTDQGDLIGTRLPKSEGCRFGIIDVGVTQLQYL